MRRWCLLPISLLFFTGLYSQYKKQVKRIDKLAAQVDKDSLLIKEKVGLFNDQPIDSTIAYNVFCFYNSQGKLMKAVFLSFSKINTDRSKTEIYFLDDSLLKIVVSKNYLLKDELHFWSKYYYTSDGKCIYIKQPKKEYSHAYSILLSMASMIAYKAGIDGQ